MTHVKEKELLYKKQKELRQTLVKINKKLERLDRDKTIKEKIKLLGKCYFCDDNYYYVYKLNKKEMRLKAIQIWHHQKCSSLRSISINYDFSIGNRDGDEYIEISKREFNRIFNNLVNRFKIYKKYLPNKK